VLSHKNLFLSELLPKLKHCVVMEGEKWSNHATRSGSSSPLSLHTTGEPPIFTVAGIACKSGGLQELRLPAISLPVMDSPCFRRGVARLPLPQTRNKGAVAL
jgi:hypothetical protein